MRIAVFCSSSAGVSPMVFSETELIGETLAQEGHEVVFGGCISGCMGALANGVLRKKGRLIGVIPQLDFMEGTVQLGLAEQHIVPSLSSRKEKMIALSDGFVVMPGGLGTLDEALEVLAIKACGNFEKPIVFYNFLDLWTPFLEAMELLVQQKFIRQPLHQLLVVLDKPDAIREHFSKHHSELRAR